MCFIPKIVLCLISVNQMHTFVLLNMFCQFIVLNVEEDM